MDREFVAKLDMVLKNQAEMKGQLNTILRILTNQGHIAVEESPKTEKLDTEVPMPQKLNLSMPSTGESSRAGKTPACSSIRQDSFNPAVYQDFGVPAFPKNTGAAESLSIQNQASLGFSQIEKHKKTEPMGTHPRSLGSDLRNPYKRYSGNLTDFIPMNYADLFALLMEKNLITPRPLRPVIPPYPRWYDHTTYCIFHLGVRGHPLERCAVFKSQVLDLMEGGQLKFSENGEPIFSKGEDPNIVSMGKHPHSTQSIPCPRINSVFRNPGEPHDFAWPLPKSFNLKWDNQRKQGLG